MKFILAFCFCILAFSESIESKNKKLRRTNEVLLKTLQELAVGEEEKVAERPGPQHMYCGHNECKRGFDSCSEAIEELDEDKDKDDLLDCPKGWSEVNFCKEDHKWPRADQFIRVCKRNVFQAAAFNFELRGATGDETVTITDGVEKSTINLRKSSWKTFPAYNANIVIRFDNDGGSRDVFFRSNDPVDIRSDKMFPGWRCGTSSENSRCEKVRNGEFYWGGDYEVKFETSKTSAETELVCDWISGDGQGNGEEKISSTITGTECVKACYKKGGFNGATIKANGANGCWCERNMNRVKTSSSYKTCYIKPKGLTCDYISGDGTGRGEVKIEDQISGEACAIECHRRGEYNGATVLSSGSCTQNIKDGCGCWCEKGMNAIRSSNTKYKTCYIRTESSGEKEGYKFVGSGWCRPSAGLGWRVNGYFRDSGKNEAACRSQCNLESNCIGYAVSDDDNPTYDGKCYIHVSEGTVTPKGWESFPRSYYEISSASGEAKVSCFRSTECILKGGEIVSIGWSGPGTGNNYCNTCHCSDMGLMCTRRLCEPKA